MAKTLMGAVLRKAQIEATYQVTVLGETSSKSKAKDWPSDVISASADFVQLCDELTPEIDDVVGVQIYTPITDPMGGGVCIDLLFRDGDMHRVENPPQDIAASRDALKAAIAAAL